MHYREKLKLSLLACLFSTAAYTQEDSLPGKHESRMKNIFSVGVGLQQGFIFAHTAAVLNTKGSHPAGVEGILSWQRNDAQVWDLCNCYPRKGLLLALYDFDSPILGKGYTAAYFLEPMYRIRGRFFFSFRASAGLSWLTNPFDSISNPANQSYSTRLNNYLLAGVGTWFNMNDHWWLNLSLNYQHDSNGGMKEPNKGINWPTAGFTLSYQKTSRPFYRGARSNNKQLQPLRVDLGIYGTASRSLDEKGNSSQWPLLGISALASRQVGRLSALTVSAEAWYDESLRIKLQRFGFDASPLKAGVMIGHEFILGRFLFSQRLGIYVFDQTPYYDLLFHRWGIHYLTARRLGIGLSLLAHRHIADFVDLRLTYSIQKKITGK